MKKKRTMKKCDYDYAIVIDDYDNDESIVIDKTDLVEPIKKPRKPRTAAEPLKKYWFEDINTFEIGVDEAGRGPLFGRVYTAAVILPKDDSFDHSLMKDSKKFHSKKKIEEVADYIKQHAIGWSVTFEDEKVIDKINILQATQESMHHAIANVMNQYRSNNKGTYSFYLLIDGNYFNPFTYFNKKTNKIENTPHVCIEGGDNKYTAIAAASILAKVERDRYIEQLCEENPHLVEKYGIDSNKGYGAKKHLDGIKQYGITGWHRKSFGICKSFT